MYIAIYNYINNNSSSLQMYGNDEMWREGSDLGIDIVTNTISSMSD